MTKTALLKLINANFHVDSAEADILANAILREYDLTFLPLGDIVELADTTLYEMIND